jgi:hypothetical protein
MAARPQETLPEAASDLEAMGTQSQNNTEESEHAISNIARKGKEHLDAFSGTARSQLLICIALSC